MRSDFSLNSGRYMKKAGVTVFYINRGEYAYRESGGNRVYSLLYKL